VTTHREGDLGSKKLWLITRTDKTDSDETNSLVIRAETEEEARAVAIAPDPDYDFDPDEPEYRPTIHPGLNASNVVVAELTADGEPGVIVHDFIRG
jgi:hypothetical protein